MKKFPVVASVLIVVFTAARAADIQSVGPLLTPKVQDLLRQEMQAVLQATHEVLDASTEGDYTKLAARAEQIHDSFILEQGMTEEDRRSLLAALPTEFVELDEQFHTVSGDLAAAARARDQQLVARYMGDLVAACGNCHRRFATNRFPEFAMTR